MSKKKRKFIEFRALESNSKLLTSDGRKPEHEQSLRSALKMFVNAKEAENVRPRTIEEYYKHIRYFSDFLKIHLDVVEVDLSLFTSENIYAYINYLKNEKERYNGIQGRSKGYIGLSPTTINIRLRTLRTMCRFWHNKKLLEENPMEFIKPLRHDIDVDDSVRGFTERELPVILNSFDERRYSEWRDKIICLLMLDTGLRPTEAVELPKESLDFKTLTIEVFADVAKSRRSRIVPMSKDIARLLRDLIKETEAYFGDSNRVFLSSYGDEITASTFRKRLNRKKVAIGFDKLSPNQFRHTFCRSYIMNGGDLFTLQKIVGHQDIKTTRKYVQVDYDHIEQQHHKYSPIKKILYRN